MQILHHLKPLIMLEIGSGTDLFSYHIKRILPNSYVIRSDIEELLVEASYKDSLENVFCDGLRLPFKESSFNSIVTINVVHHLTSCQQMKFFHEIRKVLRSAGHYILVEVINPHRSFRACVIHTICHHLIRRENMHWFPEIADIVFLLRLCTLEVLYFRLHNTWRGKYLTLIAKKR